MTAPNFVNVERGTSLEDQDQHDEAYGHQDAYEDEAHKGNL